jgi:hypothetical protein
VARVLLCVLAMPDDKPLPTEIPGPDGRTWYLEYINRDEPGAAEAARARLAKKLKDAGLWDENRDAGLLAHDAPSAVLWDGPEAVLPQELDQARARR